MLRHTVCAILFAGVILMNTLATEPAPSSARGLLLVANKGDQTVSFIDPATGRQIATVKESGVTTHELTASPDGRTAYAPVYGNSGVGAPGSDGRTLDIIDVASRRVIATLDFGRPVRPHCAMFGPRDGLLYVTTELTNSIDVIDPGRAASWPRFPPASRSRTCWPSPATAGAPTPRTCTSARSAPWTSWPAKSLR